MLINLRFDASRSPPLSPLVGALWTRRDEQFRLLARRSRDTLSTRQRELAGNHLVGRFSSHLRTEIAGDRIGVVELVGSDFPRDRVRRLMIGIWAEQALDV
jgi:hypothetical protein